MYHTLYIQRRHCVAGKGLSHHIGGHESSLMQIMMQCPNRCGAMMAMTANNARNVGFGAASVKHGPVPPLRVSPDSVGTPSQAAAGGCRDKRTSTVAGDVAVRVGQTRPSRLRARLVRRVQRRCRKTRPPWYPGRVPQSRSGPTGSKRCGVA